MLALRRPELFCSLTIHEPTLIGAASAQPRLRPQLDEVEATIGSAAAQLRDGDLVGGAKRFVEDVALGPGAWQELPPDVRDEIVRNARGFLGDIEDPGWADLDLAASVRIGCPALVTWEARARRGYERSRPSSPAGLRALSRDSSRAAGTSPT